jgi:type II secretory pathway component GspD/PulD (secretin)
MTKRPFEHRVRSRLAKKILAGALCFAAATAWIQTGAFAQQPTTNVAPTTVPVPVINQGPTTSNGAAPGPNGVVAEGDILKINFRDASIDTVLDELSRVGGYSIVKTVQTQGRIPSMVNLQGVPRSEAINLLNTALAEPGYVALKQGNVLKIVPRQVARTSSIPTLQLREADPTKVDPTDELVTCVIPL